MNEQNQLGKKVSDEELEEVKDSILGKVRAELLTLHLNRNKGEERDVGDLEKAIKKTGRIIEDKMGWENPEGEKLVIGLVLELNDRADAKKENQQEGN